jgi:hypothetical protein
MKIVVPNATAGLIIGQGGTRIKQIKDDTGAFLQVSQKTDSKMSERVITIQGLNDFSSSVAFDTSECDAFWYILLADQAVSLGVLRKVGAFA